MVKKVCLRNKEKYLQRKDFALKLKSFLTKKGQRMFKIEKGVPSPKGKYPGRPALYPFNEMVPGDSFYVPDRSIQKNVKMAAHSYGRSKTPAWRFSVRLEGAGFRVYRVE